MRIANINYNYIYHQPQALTQMPATAPALYPAIRQNYSVNNSPSFEGNRISDIFKSFTKIFSKENRIFPDTLYRVIGEDELKILLKGKTPGEDKFCSRNPMGWEGSNWCQAFRSNDDDIYFVTFKNKHFRSKELYAPDIKDIWADKNKNIRFKIMKPYTLEDIDNIRIGYCTHGELIWPDIKTVKLKDRQVKQKRIQELIQEISTMKKKNYSCLEYYEKRNILFKELASYCKEFPKSALPLLDIIDKNSFNDVKSFIEVASYSKDRVYYPFVVNHLKNAIKNDNTVLFNTIKYIGDCGTNKDLDLVLQMFQKDRNWCWKVYQKTITSLMQKKDIPKIKQIGLNSDLGINSNYLILNVLLEKWAEPQDILDVSRHILKRILLLSNGDKNQRNKSIILSSTDNLLTVMDVLEKYGEKSDLPELKKLLSIQNDSEDKNRTKKVISAITKKK